MLLRASVAVNYFNMLTRTVEVKSIICKFICGFSLINILAITTTQLFYCKMMVFITVKLWWKGMYNCRITFLTNNHAIYTQIAYQFNHTDGGKAYIYLSFQSHNSYMNKTTTQT